MCTAAACFAARSGAHIAEAERALGVTAGYGNAQVSLQQVRCLGFCYAGPACLDGDQPNVGADLAAQLAAHARPVAPPIPVSSAADKPVVLAGIVAGQPAWRPGQRADRRGPAVLPTARVTPVFGGLSYQRLAAEGALTWPCPSPDAPGEAKLYTAAFATPDGRARLAAAPYLPPGERPDDDYPFVLVTGRRWAHYNSGNMTRRTDNIRPPAAKRWTSIPVTPPATASPTGRRSNCAAGTARRC